MFDAAAKVAAERRRVVWVTPAVNLYVVGVLVRRQTLSLDDVDNVGSCTSRTGVGPVRTPAARRTGRWTVPTARRGDTCAADAGPG